MRAIISAVLTCSVLSAGSAWAESVRNAYAKIDVPYASPKTVWDTHTKMDITGVPQASAESDAVPAFKARESDMNRGSNRSGLSYFCKGNRESFTIWAISSNFGSVPTANRAELKWDDAPTADIKLGKRELYQSHARAFNLEFKGSELLYFLEKIRENPSILKIRIGDFHYSHDLTGARESVNTARLFCGIANNP